ncbi:MAG: hypothetical protein QOJ99_2391 [Bryobacterales bacterium]|nr:hypothetical protein [Bryobacterales bacterium]
MLRTLVLSALAIHALFAQNASLTGRVTDESGAVVAGATVTLTGSSGTRQANSGPDGTYNFSNLNPASFKIFASAPQLGTRQPVAVTIHSGSNSLNLELAVAAAAQQLTVTDNAGPGVSTEASSNASATIIKGEDLDALSDDPADLQADLEALAGPSAGPSGGAIFVDGFSGGQLPPKESIREIRINSNPFSPEYDKLGYGRIEIFTKPGSDKFHGSVGYNLGTDRWNSRNPYSAQKAPLLLQETENSLSGPLGKHSSFTVDAEYQAVDNGSITNAVILDPATLSPAAFSSVLKTPQRHTLVGPHVDYQLNENNTLAVRYLYTRADIKDGGIGSFDLISRGTHILHTFNTAQVIETSVHGSMVNETRFQYFRSDLTSAANTVAPVIQVLGAFTGGGATLSQGSDLQNSYELQNYTSLVHGTHFMRFGVRLRAAIEDSFSPLNFNGTFTFSSIAQYQRGIPSQFSVNGGMPNLAVHQFDGALFFGDDWKVRQNLTLSLGVRYESQTNIRDLKDVAPRVAFAWAPGATGKKQARTVIRGGVGMFYDRFALTNSLTAARYNGIVQQQYVVINPDFYPAIPTPASLAASRSPQAVQTVDANLRAPYIVQSALTLERQLPKNTTIAVTYTNSHGLHVFRSMEVPSAKGPVYLMTSSGLYNQNQLITNVNAKLNAGVSLFAYYTLNSANSNSDGLGTFPANPANFTGEYGPAATDIRHRVLVGGTVSLRWNVRLNPLVTVQSGAPFNITTGQDNYGTTLYTARPGIATDTTRPGLVQTPYGLLDPNPIPGEFILPRNYGRGPDIISFNLRVGRTWGFGPEKGSGSGAVRSSRDSGSSAGPVLAAPTGNRGLFNQPSTPRKYNLTVSMSGRNLLNHTNQGPIIGNITSALFGRANQMAGTPNGEGFSEAANNRRLELQIRFTY